MTPEQMARLREAVDLKLSTGHVGVRELLDTITTLQQEGRHREITAEWESCLERDRTHRQEMQDMQGQWQQAGLRAEQAEATTRRLEDELNTERVATEVFERQTLAAEMENRRLRETLEEARIYVDLTYRLSSDRFVQMRSSACVDRIDAALAPTPEGQS